jgi:hypothetical protein
LQDRHDSGSNVSLIFITQCLNYPSFQLAFEILFNPVLVIISHGHLPKVPWSKIWIMLTVRFDRRDSMTGDDHLGVPTSRFPAIDIVLTA